MSESGPPVGGSVGRVRSGEAGSVVGEGRNGQDRERLPETGVVRMGGVGAAGSFSSSFFFSVRGFLAVDFPFFFGLAIKAS